MHKSLYSSILRICHNIENLKASEAQNPGKFDVSYEKKMVIVESYYNYEFIHKGFQNGLYHTEKKHVYYDVFIYRWSWQ